MLITSAPPAGRALALPIFLAPGQPNPTFAWDASTNAAGYRLYFGTQSRAYSSMVDAGNLMQTTIPNLTNGVTYFLAVAAYSSNGVESDFSSEISYTAGNTPTNPPSITLTSPGDGAVFTEPANIDFAAGVNSNGHTISKVLFYSGSILIGQSAQAPYSFTWNNVAAGNYALTARLLYDGAFEVSSPVANVSVSASRPPPPGLSLTLAMTPEHLPLIEGAGAVGGHNYAMQTTSNFVTWTSLGNVTADANGHFSFTDSSGASVLARFYRAKDLTLPASPTLGLSPTLVLSMTAQNLPLIAGDGTAGHNYEVQATQNLLAWAAIGSVTADNAGHFSFTDSGAGGDPARFYRVRDLTAAGLADALSGTLGQIPPLGSH